ncbi:uncharacterized protein C1orf50 homolog [Rhagoletis pomonella]|uniref:uncharacterized protein C1orf50 homolog n=1 Tax=Rhagoletis pomonella TaxID=28610 RepID=UPI001781CA43|nr:uncharacterized protein C1orf50 homolog [Rhagoletis pomonella]XP_036344019.1 uncharacterized protein C1orf50 homolog [Rhagoletis pomonella]
MKRCAIEMERLTYETAVKKAQLVERNPHPNGVHIVDPLRVSMHQEEDIISLATQIQNADKQLKSGTCQKLCVILDQIKMLQAQAMQILKESEESKLLHNAACNFTKKPGHIYHLYQRSSGQSYFSMLSPEEWNGGPNQKYLGSYRLEFDLSWTPLEKIKERDEKMNWAEKCLETTTLAVGPIPMAIEFGNTEK